LNKRLEQTTSFTVSTINAYTPTLTRSLLTVSPLAEIFGSDTKANIKNPLTAAYLRVEKGPAASPPVYDFDEAGIVLEGNNI